MKKIKNLFFGVSFFYLAFYLPIALMSYFPQWYTFNCKLHPRCKFIGYANASKYIDELTGFFLHRNPLSNDWTVKERLHLAEVRDILDVLVIIAFICIVVLIVTFNRSKISTYSVVNLGIILSLFLVLFFFKTFWEEIFHPLFFDNDLWKNNYLDRSFYIMPGVFFKHSLIFLIALSSLLNGLTWFIFRKRSKKGPGKKKGVKLEMYDKDRVMGDFKTRELEEIKKRFLTPGSGKSSFQNDFLAQLNADRTLFRRLTDEIKRSKNVIVDIKISGERIYVFTVSADITIEKKWPVEVYNLKGQVVKKGYFRAIPAKIWRNHAFFYDRDEEEDNPLILKYNILDHNSKKGLLPVTFFLGYVGAGLHG